MGSSPQQPNPYTSMMMAQALGAQQAQANQQAAQEQQKMNMVGQSTPYGSLTYKADPNSPSGYTAVQSYSQPVQDVLNQNISNAQGSANAAGNLLNSQGGALGQGVDLSYGADAQRIAQIEQQTLDPMWARNQNIFDQSMADKGVMPGSAAYNNAYTDYQNSKNNAYNNMFLNAYQTANNAAVSQYDTNLNGLNSLENGGSITNPASIGLTSTPQETIQAPNLTGTYQDMMGNQQQQYNNQLNQYGATMGGLFGLGGSVAGSLLGPAGSAAGNYLGSQVGNYLSGSPSYVTGGLGGYSVPTY
jgi:hypothetical protein